jgi:YVTN family beta-propeller protein
MRIAWTFIGLAACTASASEVQPPEDVLFYPTGMAIAPGEAVLFVANANSELRYDSGSVVAIDLAQVDRISADWIANKATPDSCAADVDHSETLACGDQSKFMVQHAGARIGNFATSVAVQDTGAGSLRLIVPTRGDPSVAWIDWDGSRLSCNPGAQGFAQCDDAHRLSYIHNDPNLANLPDEPFGVFADSTNNFAVVSHLTTGAVTLIDSPPGRNAVIADVAIGQFQPDPQTGIRGATGIAGRTPGSPNDIIYVGSRSENRIQMYTVGRPVNFAEPFLIPGNWFFLDFVGASAGNSSDTRAITFSPGGDRMYVVNRRPATLQIVNTSLGPTGFPIDKGVAVTNICRQASTVSVMDAGDGERAYVTCFQSGEIYVVDPRGASSVEAIVTVGRGPYTVVTDRTHKKLYVSNFLEDTIAVIDVSPSSKLRNRVVLRIGQPRSP